MFLKLWQAFVDRVDLSRFLIKFLFLVEVVGVPIFLLVMAPIALAPEWQSGKPMDYVSLWFSSKVQFVFYPMIVWAVIALLALMKQFDKSSKTWWVRSGIYMGTVWCWIYLIYELLSIGSNFFSKEMVLPFLVFGGWLVFICRLVCLRNSRNDKYIVIGLCLTFVVLVMFQNNPVAGGILGVAFVSTPLVAAILTTALSYRLKNIKSVKTPKIWTIGFWSYTAIAFVESVIKLFYEYDRLPKTPPHSCFIVTAANTGHKWIVKDDSQLRHFHDFEIRLRHRFPHLHHFLRSIYNFLSPPIARFVSKNRILADTTYILLKPLEIVLRNKYL